MCFRNCQSLQYLPNAKHPKLWVGCNFVRVKVYKVPLIFCLFGTKLVATNVSNCMVTLAFYCSILKATLNQWLPRRNLKIILPRKKEERREKRIERERVLVNNSNATVLALIIRTAKNIIARPLIENINSADGFNTIDLERKKKH